MKGVAGFKSSHLVKNEDSYNYKKRAYLFVFSYVGFPLEKRRTACYTLNCISWCLRMRLYLGQGTLKRQCGHGKVEGVGSNPICLGP